VTLFRRLVRRLRRAEVLDAPAAYGLWAPGYPPEPWNLLMEREEAAVLELLPDPVGRRALDLACGTGRYLRRLGAAGAASVAGLDLSEAMLRRDASPRRVRGDLRRLPFGPAAFDLVVCGLALGHVVELDAALAEASRVLVAGGSLVYSDVHPAGGLAGWKRTFRDAGGGLREVEHHVHLYADHLRACRGAGLAIEDVREPRLGGEGKWAAWPAVLAVRVRKTG
jgi:malonyl-CoA O-methyltransferase